MRQAGGFTQIGDGLAIRDVTVDTHALAHEQQRDQRNEAGKHRAGFGVQWMTAIRRGLGGIHLWVAG